MIKIFVFDTNSLISAHLLPNSVTRQAYNLAMYKGILVHSVDTLREFTETFARSKFDKYVNPALRHKAISVFEKRSFLIDIAIQIKECRDVKDNKFLELAVASMADCIVTGDNDLLVMHPFRDIPVLTASNFVASFQ